MKQLRRQHKRHDASPPNRHPRQCHAAHCRAQHGGAQPHSQRSSADSSTPLATAEIVFTTGAPVLRYDWARDRVYIEELAVEPGCIRLQRLEKGAPLLSTHSSYDLESVLIELATRDAASGGYRNVRIETVNDEMQTRMAGIEMAITHRVAAGTKLDDKPFAGPRPKAATEAAFPPEK